MRTINEVSKEDCKGDISDVSRDVSQANKRIHSSSRIVTKPEEQKREDIHKKRSLSIHSMSPRTSIVESNQSVHFIYLAQLLCDFFQGLKTRVVDKELLDIFSQLSRNQEEFVILSKAQRLKLSFMGRLS